MATNDVIELKRVNDYLTKIDADFDEMIQHTDGTFEIHIWWGDWKHSHLLLDNAMKDLGYKKTYEEVTEEDGSDCYSSIHYYEKIVEG